MTEGPFGGPRPLVSSAVKLTISVENEDIMFFDIDETGLESEISVVEDRFDQEFFQQPVFVDVSDSLHHGGVDVTVNFKVSEVPVSAVARITEIINSRVDVDISDRNIRIGSTDPTGPFSRTVSFLRVNRPLAVSTVKIRTQLGIDGSFPSIDVQISTEEVIRSDLTIQSNLAEEIGVAFEDLVPRDSRLEARSQYMIDVIAETGEEEVRFEHINDIIRGIINSVGDLNFIITSDISSIVVG